MNIAYYIAKRFSFDKVGKNLLSRSIVRLSVFSIALSIAVMIITLAVVTGFKKEIRNKAVGFGSHIQLTNFDSNSSFESFPINANQDFLPEIKKLKGVKNIQAYATKPGIIKAGKENQGMIAKGIGPDYDWTFFQNNLVEGEVLSLSDSSKTNDVLISKKISSLLQLSIDDEFPMFFFDERSRAARFRVKGIFETSLVEFDKQFLLVDIKHIQRLYNWDTNQISGYEIIIDEYSKINKTTYQIRDIAGYHFLDDGSRLRVTNIREKNPQIFQWLNLLDMNVKIILLLMIIVAIVNMISGLIILILDRTHAIGLLKALGSNNNTIKKIFLFQSLFLILKGMIAGNLIALIVCFIQKKYQLISLDQSSYFIDYVPINLTPAIIIGTNLGGLALIFLAMYLPTLVILRIDPVKTLRYN